MKNWFSTLSVIGLLVVSTQSAQAFSAKGIDWGKFTAGFNIQGQEFNGNVTRTVTWEETLCDGKQVTTVNFRGKMLPPEIDVQDDGSIKVYAQTQKVVLPIHHSYRSEIFLCNTVAGTYTPWIDWADFHAIGTFKDNGSLPPTVTVKITGSQIGRIHFQSGLGSEFEYFLTSLVNSQLDQVWASSLGDQISAFLGKEFQTLVGKQ